MSTIPTKDGTEICSSFARPEKAGRAHAERFLAAVAMKELMMTIPATLT